MKPTTPLPNLRNRIHFLVIAPSLLLERQQRETRPRMGLPRPQVGALLKNLTEANLAGLRSFVEASIPMGTKTSQRTTTTRDPCTNLPIICLTDEDVDGPHIYPTRKNVPVSGVAYQTPLVHTKRR